MEMATRIIFSLFLVFITSAETTLKGKKTCPVETLKNITWTETIAGTTIDVACNDGFSGTISRPCSIDGKWGNLDDSNCSSGTKPHAFENREAIEIITTVGCILSIFSLALTIMIYGICWKNVTFHDVTRSQSILLMNLCVSLIIVYMLSLILIEETRETMICPVIAALIHYFFLISFFALLAEGVDMVIALTVIFTSKITRLPWLLAFSWGGPAIILLVTLTMTEAKGFANEQFCELTSENYVHLATIVPAVFIIAANIICVILVVKSLLSTHSILRKSTKQRLRIGVRAIGILTPLFGFSWVLGLFAINEDLLILEYIFTVINSLQGFVVFVIYCVFNKQIRKSLLKSEKPTSQKPAKTSTNIQSGNTLTELKCSSKDYPMDDYFRESLEMRPRKENDHYSTCETVVRFPDKDLDKTIWPYYIIPTPGASRNNDTP